MKAIVSEIAEKACKICTAIKPIDQFSPTGRFANGLTRHHIYCRECYSAYRRSNYDPTKRQEKAALHKEPKERAAARMARLRAENPDHYLAYKRLYRKNKPDIVRAHDRAKRAKRSAAIALTPNKLSAADWEAIVRKHDGRCFYCGMGFLKLTLDHFIPLSRGGSHSVDNVVPACGPCNSSKNAKDAFEFAASKGRPIMVKEDATAREKDIQSRILVAVTALPDALFWRNNTGSLPTSRGTHISFGLPGSADIIGAYRGRFVGIEVKTKDGRQSAKQKTFERALKSAGGIYLIARSPEEALAALGAIE